MAIGDIGAILKTEEWLDQDVYYLRAVHVSGNIYMVATLQLDGLTGIYVATVSLAADGTITVVDCRRYAECTQGGAGGFAHVSGDVWALAYLKNDGSGDDGSFIGTFTCDSDGNLGAAFIDTFLLSGPTTNMIYSPDIIHVSGNVFAAAHTDPSNDGWVTTVTINDDGSIDDAALDTWEFDVFFGRFPSFCHRYGTVYMITYGDSVPLGQLITFHIQDDGTLPAIAGSGGCIDTQPIWNRLYSKATMLPISGDVYAIVWDGTDSDGFVITYEVTTAGMISTYLDVWEYEPSYGVYPTAIVVDENQAGDGKVICAVHSALAAVNAMHTFEISNTGTITKSFIDQAVLDDTNNAFYPCIVDATEVAYGLCAVFYKCADNDGFAQTREIERAPQVPTVTTDPATGVGALSATLNGTLVNQGVAACDCGFEWGPDIGYGTTTPTQSKTTGETFSQLIAGLEPGITYHFRAFATNPAGTSYGADRTFSTEQVISASYALSRREL